MPLIPADIPVGTITANWWFADEDSIDANTDIEVVPVVSGSVFFRASVTAIRLPGKPATVIPLIFEGTFDSLGNLTAKNDPSIGMKLPATDSPLTNPTGFTWHVTFNIKDAQGNPVTIPEFDIQVPTGGTVDLTNAVPISTSPGTLTVQGPKGDKGDPNVLVIGNVATGAPGSPAQVVIAGTSPSQTLNFTLPQGATGPAGPTGPAGAAGNVSQTIDTLGSLTVKRTNLDPNPSFEAAGPVATLWTNLIGNPRLGINSNGWASNWYGGGTSTGTTARVADSQFFGGWAWQKTWTAVGGNAYDTAVTQNGIAVTAGNVYSFSARIRGNCAMPVSMSVAWYNSGGTEISGTRSLTGGIISAPETILTPNAAPITVKLENLTAPTGAVTCAILVGHNNNGAYTYQVNDFIAVSNAIAVAGPYVPLYFDGTTKHPLRTNLATSPGFETENGTFGLRQNLCTNPSVETNTTGYASNAGSGGVVSTFRGTDGGYVGPGYYRTTWTTASSASGYIEYSGLSSSGITAGSVYTFSAYLRSSVTISASLTANWWNGSSSTGTTSGPAVSLPANTWTRVSITGATAPAATIGVWLDWFPTTPQALNQTIDIDGVLIEQSPVLGGYFDGATGPALRTNMATNPSFETDTSSWAMVGPAGSSLARDTSQASSGLASMKVTWATGALDAQAARFNANATAGVVYTMSADVYVPAGQPAVNLLIGTGNETKSAASTVTGAWQRLTVTNTATNSAQAYFDLRPVGAATAGQYAYIDRVLIEVSSTAGTYFEGTTTMPSDFAYAWTGTANASTSVQYGSRPRAGTGYAFGDPFAWVALSTLWSNSRSRSLRIIANGTSRDTFADITSMMPATLKRLTTYTLSGTIKLTAPIGAYAAGAVANASSLQFRANVGSTELGFTMVKSPLNSAGTYRVVGQFTTPASGTVGFIRLYSGAIMGEPDVWWDDVVLEEGATMGDPFDGAAVTPGRTNVWTGAIDASTTAQYDADNTVAWAATTDGSTSTMSVTQAAGVTYGYNCSPLQSSQWSNSRVKSLRIIPTGTNNDTSTFGLGGSESTMSFGMVAGQTYTVSATCRIEVPQTGTLNAKARTINFVYHTPTGYVETQSVAAPNVAGSTRVSVTVAVPTNADQVFIRLCNGASFGGGDVYWDDILVENSYLPGVYFDGSKAGAYWTGTTDASTSVSAGLGSGTPDNTKILRGDYVWAASPVEALMGVGDDFNSYTGSGVYKMPATPTGLNYPIAAGGLLEVWNQNSIAGYTLQEYTPLSSTVAQNGRSFYQRFQYNGTWSAWQFYGAQRWDQTAGRVLWMWDSINQREQLVYGDTGWRDVTALVPATPTFTGNIQIRRADTIVQFAYVNFAPSTTGNVSVLTLPAGFWPTLGHYLGFVHGPTRTLRSMYVNQSTGGVAINNVATANEVYGAIVSWSTTDAWPASLPGTAATGIPFN